MSRATLDDRICLARRELADLESVETNCLSCDRKRYKLNECMLHGTVPPQFMSRTDCPDWEFQSIPF